MQCINISWGSINGNCKLYIDIKWVYPIMIASLWCLMSFLFCLSLPLVVVFRGHHGYNHCNVFSLIISLCIPNSTNEEYFFGKIWLGTTKVHKFSASIKLHHSPSPKFVARQSKIQHTIWNLQPNICWLNNHNIGYETTVFVGTRFWW